MSCTRGHLLKMNQYTTCTALVVVNISATWTSWCLSGTVGSVDFRCSARRCWRGRGFGSCWGRYLQHLSVVLIHYISLKNAYVFLVLRCAYFSSSSCHGFDDSLLFWIRSSKATLYLIPICSILWMMWSCAYTYIQPLEDNSTILQTWFYENDVLFSNDFCNKQQLWYINHNSSNKLYTIIFQLIN